MGTRPADRDRVNALVSAGTVPEAGGRCVFFLVVNHRKTIGKWWFYGIWNGDLASGKWFFWGDFYGKSHRKSIRK